MYTVEKHFFAFLIGFVVATLLCLSIKYPLQVDSIDKYKPYCHESKIESIKVGFSGDIYSLICEDGYKTRIR